MSTPIGPSGWHPDPYGRFEYRYHNGVQWTADVAMAGRRFVDPNGAPGAPAAPGTSTAPFANLPSTALPTRGLAVASFIVGLISALVAWIPFVFAAAAVGAVLAFVLGVIGARKASTQGGHGRGFAIAGIALSVAAALLCVVGFVFTRVVLDEFRAYTNPGQYELGPIDCNQVDAVVTMSGSIRNTDRTVQDYTVELSIESGGSEIVNEVVAVDRVAPGETATFQSTETLLFSGESDLTCRVLSVNGPMPFDIAPGNLDR